jgi:hypothetical protein
VENSMPGLMSLTRAVPSAVPSVLHNSAPVSAWAAEKRIVPLTRVKSLGSEGPGCANSFW